MYSVCPPLSRHDARPSSACFKLGYLKQLFGRAFIQAQGLRQNERLRVAEDFHFLLDCLLAGARLAADPAPGYRYRQTPGSLSRRLSGQDLQELAAANRALLARAEAQSDPDLRDRKSTRLNSSH